MPRQAEALPLAVQGELRKGDSGLLHRVMTAFSRPTRIVRGKDVAASWQVREDLFELEEEPQLLAAFQRVQGQVRAMVMCMGRCGASLTGTAVVWRLVQALVPSLFSCCMLRRVAKPSSSFPNHAGGVLALASAKHQAQPLQ